jgi:hypothetical protein
MAKLYSKFFAFSIGTLCSFSLYIMIAAGDGMIPDAVADYSVYIALLSSIISWITVDSHGNYVPNSLAIGLIFSIVFIVQILMTAFIVGLPGTDFVTMGQFSGLLVAPLVLAMIVVIRQIKAFRLIAIGFCISSILIISGVHAFTDAFVGLSINRTIKNGGYVIACSYAGSDRRRAVSTADISFGLIVGHRSDRVVFVTNGGPEEWRYSLFKKTSTSADTCNPGYLQRWSRSTRFNE